MSSVAESATPPVALPLVSIGVPAYNAIQYINETVQSILAQDYPNIELLIQDNCSTDGTWELAQSLAARHPQISVQQNKSNIGMIGNFNRVINRASGSYVMVISADDFLEPTFVKCCVDVFLQSPQVDVVTTNYRFYKDGHRWQKLIKLSPGIHRRFVAGVVIANSFVICFTVFKRDSLNKLKVNGNLFPISFYTSDLDMWLRIAFSGLATYFLPEPLGNYRMHTASTSTTQFMHMFKQIFLVLMMHRASIKRDAPLAYRIKLARFTLRHIGHLASGRSRDLRLMKAIVGELLR